MQNGNGGLHFAMNVLVNLHTSCIHLQSNDCAQAITKLPTGFPEGLKKHLLFFQTDSPYNQS